MKEQPVDARPSSRPVAPVQVLPDEALVADARGCLTPAQMVERKLMTMLHHVPLPVSRFQGVARGRALS